MQFTDYQSLASSEKLTLATVDASKRLMGWVLHSGSVYKLTGVTFPVIVSLEDSGTAYTEVASVGAVTASKFYLDRDNQTLYIRTTGSDNPNGRFLVATYRLFFASSPIALAYDLGSGFEVFWEPMIKSNSAFGVEIDTINQTSEAIEGSGSLTLHNDQDFWPSSFDKLSFENNLCSIYSYHRDLDPTEAKLIFRGRVESRTYSAQSVGFKLKDTLSELRAPIPLSTIASLGQRNSPSVDLAYQRMIFGRVFGFRPTNIDEVNSGYPLTGTVAVTQGSATVTGTGTSFLAKLSPDDQLDINGTKYTVASVASNTSLTLTENFSSTTASGLSALVIPDQPKRWINRVWKLAGHALKEPVMTTLAGSTVTDLVVDSTANVFEGDTVYVGTLGSGEIATVSRVVNSQRLKLSTSLASAPSAGVTVRRPAVQNVRINDTQLIYYRDYTFNASTATLTLRDTAEANAFPVRQLSTSLAFTSGSRSVTGTGLDAVIKPGYMVGCVGQADFFEVLAVSETGLTLRSSATFTSTASGLYKSFIYSPDDVLSCDVFGRTVEGTTTGTFIRNGPTAIKVLLTDLGLDYLLDTDSFTQASEEAGQDIGLVIPKEYSETTLPTYRDTINSISKSIMGALVQTDAFNLSYFIIQPNKSTTSLRLREEDILEFSADNTAQNMVKTAIVSYRPREYDFETKNDSIRIQQKTSDTSTYVLKTDREKTFATYLVEESDAEILANRWAFLLEQSSGALKIRTKLQGALVEVGDVIDIEHRKLFERFGSTDKRRIVMVEKVTKNGLEVSIEAVDLSNAFNRVATINTGTSDWSAATDEEKIYNGYITDQYGMISNDPDTFGLNLIY